MANFNTIRKDIENQFKNNWNAITYPVAYDNTTIDVPAGPWVRLSIVPSISRNAVFGEETVRNSGNISVQIFTPLDQGAGESYAIADLVIVALANKTVNGHLFTYAARVINIGEGVRRLKDIESGLYQINVLIPYDSQ